MRFQERPRVGTLGREASRFPDSFLSCVSYVRSKDLILASLWPWRANGGVDVVTPTRLQLPDGRAGRGSAMSDWEKVIDGRLTQGYIECQ